MSGRNCASKIRCVPRYAVTLINATWSSWGKWKSSDFQATIFKYFKSEGIILHTVQPSCCIKWHYEDIANRMFNLSFVKKITLFSEGRPVFQAFTFIQKFLLHSSFKILRKDLRTHVIPFIIFIRELPKLLKDASSKTKTAEGKVSCLSWDIVFPVV